MIQKTWAERPPAQKLIEGVESDVEVVNQRVRMSYAVVDSESASPLLGLSKITGHVSRTKDHGTILDGQEGAPEKHTAPPEKEE